MTLAGFGFLAAIGVLAAGYCLRRNDDVRSVDFARDIRPILNQTCTSCHGGVRQFGNVSFISREEALGKGKSGRPTVVPGNPRASEFIARVTSRDPETRMPYHAPPLQPQQIALLRQWIEEGAQWEDHWAFVAPRPQALPKVKRTQWPRQPLDRIVLARLEREHLEPSPEATRPELLRRASLDLTGLPPTPEELAVFLADPSPLAYEKQVDRLLASPHYGERWASLWLDLARYADSKGYERDPERITWLYRDWVINAFNANMSYDRFVITQLAGDLLPDPTLEDRVATAFQRQTPANDEGGTDDEEYRLVAVMDRVATTWSILNGLTINCVQCHSHPYDPIRHREYYQSLAFFNTSQDADCIDDKPILWVPRDAALRTEMAHLERRRDQLIREIVADGRSIEQGVSWTPLPIAEGVINEQLAFENSLRQLRRLKTNELPKEFRDGKIIAQLIAEAESRRRAASTRKDLPAVQIEAGVARVPGTVPAQSVYGLLSEPASPLVTALRVAVPPINPEQARHTPEDGFVIDRIDAWIVSAQGHEQKIAFRYFAPDSQDAFTPHRSLEDWALRLTDQIFPPQFQDTGRFSAYPKLFRKRWIVAIPERPLSLQSGSRIKVHLTQMEVVDGRPPVVRQVRFDTSRDERWTAFANDETLHAKLDELKRLKQQMASIPATPVPVMAEQPQTERRQTLVFERGNFLTKTGPALGPDVPAIFPKLPQGATRDRLTLARWFFAPGQPLTARVAVNRYWEQLFGTGLVETLEDFGSAGQAPSHPELLDWLALHFQNDLHWDIKALLRELVSSAAYRQSAKVGQALLERDSGNRLLARGPQQRLTAEMVRDQALLASGLLSRALGGPPVMPPQPTGVWMTVYNGAQWKEAQGPDRYRRAIYTYLKRSAIYPSFITFDASDHVVSLARRIPTNTPLQALVTLNDTVYHEAAAALAKRMLQAGGLKARLNFGARYVLSRDLLPEELAALESLYMDARTGSDDRTALTVVASVLLNLDAALTR